jgi:hypothetical protein
VPPNSRVFGGAPVPQPPNLDAHSSPRREPLPFDQPSGGDG